MPTVPDPKHPQPKGPPVNPKQTPSDPARPSDPPVRPDEIPSPPKPGRPDEERRDVPVTPRAN